MQGTQETQFRSLGQEDPLEGEMAAHSRIFAWKITLYAKFWFTESWVKNSSDLIGVFILIYLISICSLYLCAQRGQNK